MLKIKENVNLVGLQPQMIIAAISANDFCNTVAKVDCVITSALDAKHSDTSLHFAGFALDIRTREMSETMQNMFRNAMEQSLGTQYDVLLEGDHLHIEFQPKYNGRFNG